MPKKTPPEQVEAWSKALEEGMGYQHVAEMFGVSRATVSKHLPGRGWKRKQITEHGTFMRHHNEKMRKLTIV